jgi:hypothetical protein
MKEEPLERSDREYYYALYHALGHMAAYVTILVLLLTIGILLSTSGGAVEGRLRRLLEVGALIALLAAELYSVVRMVRLANFVFDCLPSGARRDLLLVRHPQNQLLSTAAALAVTLWDILLVLRIV